MAAGHPDQIRLGTFLADAEELTEARLRELSDPLALSLDVGLPPSVALLDQRDLDNYALPLVRRLSRDNRHFAAFGAQSDTPKTHT